jgi:hypothetical protein
MSSGDSVHIGDIVSNELQGLVFIWDI